MRRASADENHSGFCLTAFDQVSGLLDSWAEPCAQKPMRLSANTTAKSLKTVIEEEDLLRKLLIARSFNVEGAATECRPDDLD